MSMAPRRGEISARRAAAILECDARTVRRWVKLVVERRPAPIATGRIDVVGRYWVLRSEIARFRGWPERE